MPLPSIEPAAERATTRLRYIAIDARDVAGMTGGAKPTTQRTTDIHIDVYKKMQRHWLERLRVQDWHNNRPYRKKQIDFLWRRNRLKGS